MKGVVADQWASGALVAIESPTENFVLSDSVADTHRPLVLRVLSSSLVRGHRHCPSVSVLRSEHFPVLHEGAKSQRRRRLIKNSRNAPWKCGGGDADDTGHVDDE